KHHDAIPFSLKQLSLILCQTDTLSPLTSTSRAARRKRILERQEVEEIQLSVAVEVRREIARREQILKRQEIEEIQPAAAIHIRPARHPLHHHLPRDKPQRPHQQARR